MEEEADEIARIIATVCNVGGLTSLEVDQDFYDAGVSSLHALGLLVELEDTFSVVIPDTEFMQARTPRALFQVITASRAGK